MSNFKEIKIINPGWMKKQHELPCDICGTEGTSEGAHQRLGGQGGTGTKPGDDCTITLCHAHHLQEGTGWHTFYVEAMRQWPLFLKRCLLARARELYRHHYATPGEAVLLDALKQVQKGDVNPFVITDALRRFQEKHPQKNLWYRPKE